MCVYIYIYIYTMIHIDISRHLGTGQVQYCVDSAAGTVPVLYMYVCMYTYIHTYIHT